MRRLRAAVFPLALLASVAIALVVVVGDSGADLENQVFTSRAERMRLVIPRTWRVTEQPSYPGFLLWLMRSQPEGRIVITAEGFTRNLYCSWPVACRQSREPLVSRYACALREKLTAQRMRVGPVQAGPKENEENKFPSLWFEYDDGVHFLRQAIAFSTENQIVSFVLSTPNDEARRAHVRAFDQMLRTLRSLDEVPTDAAVIVTHTLGDGGVAPDDALIDGGAMFESAPAPKINPIGPCPK